MAQPPKTTILDHFAELDDPRVERTRHHNPVDIIASAICGADSWVHVERFGKNKRAWFQSFLELPYGIPSQDTFGNVSPGWTRRSCRTASCPGPGHRRTAARGGGGH